jgi:hypothetical protein
MLLFKLSHALAKMDEAFKTFHEFPSISCLQSLDLRCHVLVGKYSFLHQYDDPRSQKDKVKYLSVPQLANLQVLPCLLCNKLVVLRIVKLPGFSYYVRQSKSHCNQGICRVSCLAGLPSSRNIDSSPP